MPQAALASIIIVGSHSAYPTVPAGSLSDVRMSVDLNVVAGVGRFRFTNVSIGLETSAVFKEIIVDTADDDTGEVFLWDGYVLTNTAGVAYWLVESNGLPGFYNETSDNIPLVELRARPSPVTNGLGVGETLEVWFGTAWPDGTDVFDYLFAFGGGTDTATGALGFHAISADVVNGESLSGISDGTTIPEPHTLALLGFAAAWMLRRRRP